MAHTTDQVKTLAHSLRVINALDKRKQQGEMDPTAEAILSGAEAAVSASSGRLLLAAMRVVRDSGSQAFDPTGGRTRVTNELSPSDGRYADLAMRARS